jgi:predicted nucleotidyltransferase
MPSRRAPPISSDVLTDESRPPIRAHLLEGVYRFVLDARRRPEVLRIALIGSLTTSKADPKDADVLVAVEASTDLAALARLGRALKGHT